MKKLILLFTIAAGQLYGMKETAAIRLLPKDVKYELMRQALAVSEDLDEAISMIKKLSMLYGVDYNNVVTFKKLVDMLANRFNMPTEEIAKQFDVPEKETLSMWERWTICHTLSPSMSFLDGIKLLEKNEELKEVGNNLGKFTELLHLVMYRFSFEERGAYYISESFRNGALNKIASQYSDLIEKLIKTLQREPTNVEAVRRLVEKGVDVAGEPTILKRALSSKQIPSIKMIQFLLDNGANPIGKTDWNQGTVLDTLNAEHSGAPEYEQIKQLIENTIKEKERQEKAKQEEKEAGWGCTIQ